MMRAIEEVQLDDPRVADLPLRLRRLKGARPGAPAVLLLHGGNTCSDIYLVPDGGLAGYLAREFDVWLLDWRGSLHVTGPVLAEAIPRGGDLETERRMFTVERAAELDLPAALTTMRAKIGHGPRIGVVSWCLSGAVLSVAIAQGWLEEHVVSSAVLMTLGLFCEAPWNGWLKAEGYLLERMLATSHPKPCRGINPHTPEEWPRALRDSYRVWPKPWLPQDDDFLRPLSFMVGQPFARERLHPQLRDAALAGYFGDLHLGLYLQSGQMVRRGFIAPYGTPDVIDRTRLEEYSGDPALRAYLKPEHFRSKRVTLICAAQNRVWHRDSIDLMYEWLLNNDCGDVTKHVLPEDNIMELIWGENAARDVFPEIVRGLQERRSTAALAAE